MNVLTFDLHRGLTETLSVCVRFERLCRNAIRGAFSFGLEGVPPFLAAFALALDACRFQARTVGHIECSSPRFLSACATIFIGFRRLAGVEAFIVQVNFEFAILLLLPSNLFWLFPALECICNTLSLSSRCACVRAATQCFEAVYFGVRCE